MLYAAGSSTQYCHDEIRSNVHDEICTQVVEHVAHFRNSLHTRDVQIKREHTSPSCNERFVTAEFFTFQRYSILASAHICLSVDQPHQVLSSRWGYHRVLRVWKSYVTSSIPTKYQRIRRIYMSQAHKWCTVLIVHWIGTDVWNVHCTVTFGIVHLIVCFERLCVKLISRTVQVCSSVPLHCCIAVISGRSLIHTAKLFEGFTWK